MGRNGMGWDWLACLLAGRAYWPSNLFVWVGRISGCGFMCFGSCWYSGRCNVLFDVVLLGRRRVFSHSCALHLVVGKRIEQSHA